jgi:hypothetical protein
MILVMSFLMVAAPALAANDGHREPMYDIDVYSAAAKVSILEARLQGDERYIRQLQHRIDELEARLGGAKGAEAPKSIWEQVAPGGKGE